MVEADLERAEERAEAGEAYVLNSFNNFYHAVCRLLLMFFLTEFTSYLIQI